MFDETELEADIEALRDQLPDDVEAQDAPRPSRQRRQRGFSDTLVRKRIELTLSEEETKSFFVKVKEELQFIPAQVKVLEYWHEKRCSRLRATTISSLRSVRFIRLASALRQRHC